MLAKCCSRGIGIPSTSKTSCRFLLPSTNIDSPAEPRKITTWIKYTRWQDIEKDRLKFERYDEMAKLRFGNSGYYISAEDPGKEIDTPWEDRTREEVGMPSMDSFAELSNRRYLDHSYGAINRKLRHDQLLIGQYDQRFLPERHLTLGPDLAAAHFIVARGGAVKLVGDDKWYRKDKSGSYSLPGKRTPGFFVEAIDASGTNIMFEGMENLIDLSQLRLLSLADCPNVNDWTLGRMYQFSHSLEFLDLSGCSRISAKGVSGLACLGMLKHLRLERLESKKQKELAKVALLLEEAVPGLEVHGVDFDRASEDLLKEGDLKGQERVFQDARSNVFLHDDVGEVYLVGGEGVPENPVVDEDDLPLMLSHIRKDPPKAPIEELEQIDHLSDGKLRHFLAGSPSGIDRDEETERVLEFESKKLESSKAEVHPFMLPRTRRTDPKLLSSGESDSDDVPNNNDTEMNVQLK